MKYDHRLVLQESDHEGHVPTESDFFVVENFNQNDSVYWSLKKLINLSPHPHAKKDSFYRSKKWLKENCPELFL